MKDLVVGSCLGIVLSVYLFGCVWLGMWAATGEPNPKKAIEKQVSEALQQHQKEVDAAILKAIVQAVGK